MATGRDLPEVYSSPGRIELKVDLRSDGKYSGSGAITGRAEVKPASGLRTPGERERRPVSDLDSSHGA